MITKKYKSIFSYVAALTVGLLMVNCEQEDTTGYSTLIPNSTNLEITTEVTSVTLIEDGSVYEFTASLSQVQVVDVKLYAFQIDGDATLGDDYTLDQSLVITAGSTSAIGQITILQDGVFEETETAKIQIGNNKTANATQASATMEFTILNYSEGDLAIDFNWDMSEVITDASGEAIDPEDFANMRLILSSTPDNLNAVISTDDDGQEGFKSLIIPQDLADGTYYVVTDFTSTNEENFRDLNLNLTYNQIGLINDEVNEYANAINSSNTCAYFVTEMIVKSGDNYEITMVNEISNAVTDLAAFEGTWTGTTSYGYPTQVVTTMIDENTLSITGIAVGFMEQDWGEEISEMTTLTMDVDLVTGELTIAEAYYMTTIYDGAEQDLYYLSATGKLNQCDLGMYLDYDLIQGGTSYTDWLTIGNGYPEFIEDINIE